MEDAILNKTSIRLVCNWFFICIWIQSIVLIVYYALSLVVELAVSCLIEYTYCRMNYHPNRDN